MPYRSERIRLPESLDRRRRLSDADKAEKEKLGVIRKPYEFFAGKMKDAWKY